MELEGGCFYLPDEIWLKIFSYLDIEDIAQSVRNVSERWREIASNTRLWKGLLFRPPKGENSSYMLCILAQNPEVYSISISEEKADHRAINISCGCTKGKHLHFCTESKISLEQEMGMTIMRNLEHYYTSITCTMTVAGKKYVSIHVS